MYESGHALRITVMAAALSLSPSWLCWLTGIVECEPGFVRLVQLLYVVKSFLRVPCKSLS